MKRLDEPSMQSDQSDDFDKVVPSRKPTIYSQEETETLLGAAVLFRLSL